MHHKELFIELFIQIKFSKVPKFDNVLYAWLYSYQCEINENLFIYMFNP